MGKRAWGRALWKCYSVEKIFYIGAVDCLEGPTALTKSLPGKARVPEEAGWHLQTSKEEPQASTGSKGPWLPPRHWPLYQLPASA